ncbi:MAG: putative membrane protein YkoI [Psychromonas sp.]|jgi:uncharacterized membrane protein YkoI|uniref:PepSY domain-containing protein n=1 Tax=Psychromonas sp. TaxID=1884585 RepID=UPI0039E5DB67
MKMASLLTLILCLLFPLAASAAKGKHSTAEPSSQKNAQQLKVRSREQAIQLVKQRYPGQVLKAQSTQVGGHPGYKVKLISEGLVFYVSVDAQTGSISRN